MVANAGILTSGTFSFFRELERNNNKPWMDANRERYREAVVEPFRQLLECLAPHVLKLDSNILITGRTNENFSRINRDIRFARDKTPYYPHYYLFLRTQDAIKRGGPQFYVGVTKNGATAGFRNYSGDRGSALAQYGVTRGQGNRPWLARQKKPLGRKFDSYWYSSNKKDWMKHSGWPLEPAEWKELQAWIVRRRLSKAAAVRPNFVEEIAGVFRDVVPLYAFTGAASWKP
ncbi:MAG: DUF2461 family protein [Candidatus Acidiferrales bacterium]